MDSLYNITRYDIKSKMIATTAVERPKLSRTIALIVGYRPSVALEGSIARGDRFVTQIGNDTLIVERADA